MSLLSLCVDSTAQYSFPAESRAHSSLSCSHPDSGRLELFRSRCRARFPRGRKCADLVGRRSSALCSAKWEKFDSFPGANLEDVASGCFLSDFKRQMESNSHADFTSSGFGWKREASLDSFRQLHSEASSETTFHSKVEEGPEFLQLRESLGCLDVPDQYTAIGSRIFKRGSEALAISSIDMDRPIVTNATDFREEDVKVRPKSLRMLKRKHSIGKEAYCRKRQIFRADARTSAQVENAEGLKERFSGLGDSFKSAFSSSLFMIKTLQSHLLGLRKHLFREDLHGVLRSMHSEIQESFVWLFQQVFSCTPKLMLLTMVLLADFTVHSMSKHVALAEPPASVSISNVDGLDISKAVECLSLENSSGGDIFVGFRDRDLQSRLLPDAGYGNGGGRSLRVGGGTAGQPGLPGISPESRAMCSEDDTCGGEGPIFAQDCNHQVECGVLPSCHRTISQGASAPGEDPSLVSRHRKAVSDDLDFRLDKSCHNTVMDQETKNVLVAPVSAELQSDNYTCYDRTDLAYQHAVSLDPGNPLLLANYAQFLHLVRHDHKRAEDLFQKAVKADPVDGEVMGRFASFLWIAKRDLVEADRAYRAAVAADPTSSFHAGCYAHFLWNAGEEEESCQMNARSA